MEDEDQYQFGRYGLQRNPLYSKREVSITNEQHDAHVAAFRWHERIWMEREYRHAGERIS